MGWFTVKVFVTVGTTSFDPLIEVVDKGEFASVATLQIAEGKYAPTYAEWFRFDDQLQVHIQKADIVVCHAGAGSIFSLLQAGIVPIVVPNTIRRDQHQLEIAHWLERNRYALVALQVGSVNKLISEYNCRLKACVAFKEKRFFYKKELNQLIDES